jgi:hypothetical protein
LRNFLDFIERNRGYEDLDLAVNTEPEFVHTLRTAYLNDLSTPLHLDVHFSADGRHIEASRFLLQGYRIKDALDETAMVRELRTICDEVSTENFKVSLQQFAIFLLQLSFFYHNIKPACNLSILKVFSTGKNFF